jgi:HK97 family phage portal protein
VTFLGQLFRRSLENPTKPLTDASLLEWLGGRPGTAGQTVTETSAMRFSAVWRCVALISQVSSSLPLHVYQDPGRERVDTRDNLLDDPHPELPALEVWRLSYVHRCLWGNSYAQKIRNRAGQVVELWPITPDRVQVGLSRATGTERPVKVFRVFDDWGAEHALTSNEILHIPALGYDGVCGLSPIRAAAEGIGMGLAAEKYGAKLFGSGSTMSGILQVEQRLTKDQADALKARWQAKVGGVENAHEIAVLDNGATFESITMPNKDSQFIESRQFQIGEVARYFGIPQFLIGETSKSTSWGTGLEQQALAFVVYDLAPGWLSPTEARLNKELLRPRNQKAEYSVEGLLRGDTSARGAFYRVMREVGAFSANDIRALENRPPIEGGDTYLQPANLTLDPTQPLEITLLDVRIHADRMARRRRHRARTRIARIKVQHVPVSCHVRHLQPSPPDRFVSARAPGALDLITFPLHRVHDLIGTHTARIINDTRRTDRCLLHLHAIQRLQSIVHRADAVAARDREEARASVLAFRSRERSRSGNEPAAPDRLA